MEQQLQNDEIEIDLQELFMVLLDKIWAIITATVIGAVLAAIVTTTVMTPMYSSSTMIYVKNQGADLTSLSMADLQVSSELTRDYMVLITSRPVVNKVINTLKLDMTYEELADRISVNNPTNTRILTITVEDEDAYMAKTIADEITNVMISRTVEIMDAKEPRIVEEGTVNETPISPSLTKNVLIGGLLGMFLAAAIVVIRYLLDDTIRTPDDVAKYLDLNTLGTIPLEEGKSKKQENKLRRQKKRMEMRRDKRKRAKRKGAA